MSEISTRWWLRTDSAEATIAAPPEHVYGLVADMPRMGEWSPECQRLEWTDGATGPVEGARFIGHNVGGPRGLLKWSRKGTVLKAVPGVEFAFATEEGGIEGTVWRYQFAPTDGGTKVTESYEIRKLPLWARIVDVPTNRAKELRDGMRHTLDQLKVGAETGLEPVVPS